MLHLVHLVQLYLNLTSQSGESSTVGRWGLMLISIWAKELSSASYLTSCTRCAVLYSSRRHMLFRQCKRSSVPFRQSAGHSQKYSCGTDVCSPETVRIVTQIYHKSPHTLLLQQPMARTCSKSRKHEV